MLPLPLRPCGRRRAPVRAARAPRLRPSAHDPFRAPALAPLLAPLLLALLTACGSGGDEGHTHGPGGHSHGHGDTHGADGHAPTLTVTAWSERHEVFAELDLPVAGETSSFATHVSDLATGAPRRAGTVVYRLVPERGVPVETADHEPSDAGLYTTVLRWPAAGRWRLELVVPPEGETGPAAAAHPDADTVDLGPIEVHASLAEAERAAHDDAVDGITLLKEQQWLLGTVTAVAGRQTLREQLDAPGRVRAAPSHVADVVPPVAGRLLPVDEHFPALGDTVEAGQLLAWVQPPISDALLAAVRTEAELLRFEVEVTRAASVAERTRLLHESEARSTRELEQAEFDLRTAEAARDGARRALQAYEAAGIRSTSDGLPRFELRSPIAGVVDHVEAVAGQFVTPDAPVLQVLDGSVVHVEAHVRAEDLPLVSGEVEPRLTLSAFRGDAVEVAPQAARRVHVGLHVDERSGRAPVVFELEDPEGRWRPGTPLQVRLTSGSGAEVLAVPESALVEAEGVTVVFVQRGGETFERRVVTTGRRDAGRVEITSGLAEGERLVVEGAYAVRLASVSTAAPSHGHAH